MRNTLDILIRAAERMDAASIAAVLRDAFIEYRRLYTDRAFAVTTPDAEQIAWRMNEGSVWVAVYKGVIVGTVSAVPNGKALHIRSLAVRPPARGAKIGQLLLRQVFDFASSHHHQRLFLSTTPFLTDAIRLYRRMGFRKSNEGPHDLWGTPLITLEKEMESPKM